VVVAVEVAAADGACRELQVADCYSDDERADEQIHEARAEDFATNLRARIIAQVFIFVCRPAYFVALRRVRFASRSFVRTLSCDRFMLLDIFHLMNLNVVVFSRADARRGR
jgi:hypothetical protein